MTGIAAALRTGEQRLRKVSEELEQTADLRRAFLHVVLHDLRSPVSTVITMLEMLASGASGPLSEKQQDVASRAESRLRGLMNLLHDLQLLSDIETGHLEGVTEPVDILASLREVIEEHQDQAQQRGIKLSAELPYALGKVHGVDRLLREAVANYITNAIKYTPSGGVIAVRARHVDCIIRVEVVDNGPGIAPADQERLFQEFVRIRKPEQARASFAPGTGLGLSIVRRIAEVHGGHAGVASKIGKGSTFFIELPACEKTGVSEARPFTAYPE